MKTWSSQNCSRRGFTLVETMFAMTVGVIILGVFAYAGIGITRSLSGTERYIVGIANENRIMDYVAADLRRAVRVSILTGGASTVLKNTGSTTYSITTSTILVLGIPDYYGSNTPDNLKGSTFKTTRYPRKTLNTSLTYNGNVNPLLNGVVPWVDAQTVVSSKNVTRFAPASAGTGEIQVRYYRGPRSASDSTVCYFRAEYPSGSASPSSVVEIAERISDNLSTTTLLISARNNGQVFQLQSSFTPSYRLSGATSAPTNGVLEVSARNPRRD